MEPNLTASQEFHVDVNGGNQNTASIELQRNPRSIDSYDGVQQKYMMVNRSELACPVESSNNATLDDLDDVQSKHVDHTNDVNNTCAATIHIDESHGSPHKWIDLLTKFSFYGRFMTLILNISLLILSIFYCIGQKLETKLYLVKQCEPKSHEEIWRHSYESATRSGGIVMSPESQYGFTDDSCYTTNTIDTDTKNLWKSNVYQAIGVGDDSPYYALFAFIAVYASIIIVYNLITIIRDITSVSKGTLHTKSKLYKDYKRQLQSQPQTKQGKENKCNVWFRTYMAEDTTGWIIKSALNEITELIIQSQALLLYNGYNLFDPRGVYLAKAPFLIIMFASFVSFNCFGSGICWLSYALAHRKCHGLMFKLSLFFVDQCSDLLYTIFPLVVVLSDPYNDDDDANQMDVLLSQLNMSESSPLSFCAAFVPLFILCTKSLTIIGSAHRNLRDDYYREWRFVHDLKTQHNNNQAVYKAKLTGYKVDLKQLTQNQGEMYDANGKLLLSGKRVHAHKNWIDDDDASAKRCKIIVLVVMSLMYIAYGLFILISVSIHITNAQSHCKLIQESNFPNDTDSIHVLSNQQQHLFKTNPELFVWENCLYKVYPFTTADYKCECRVFDMEWQDTKSMERFDLTHPELLTAALNHFVMLEKFRSISHFGSSTSINSSMYKAVHMKAFELTHTKILAFDEGISSWSRLEYLKFDNSQITEALPDDFGQLKELIYLSFTETYLQFFPESICNLTKLQVLELFQEPQIESIPHCISQLTSIKQLVFDICVSLQDIPISIFNLPNMATLSLFKGFVDYESLLQYNAPSEINLNDSDASLSWFESNFRFNAFTQYWLSLNPICNDNTSEYPMTLRNMLLRNKTCEYSCEIDTTELESFDSFCPPRLLGDGRCDFFCATRGCRSDDGDCVQLCFAEQLTNCDYSLYTNHECDQECDNEYCESYIYAGSKTQFNDAKRWECADLNECSANCTDGYDVVTGGNNTCSGAHSTYLTDEFRLYMAVRYTKQSPDHDPDDFAAHMHCSRQNIGDSKCDDLCRSDDCDNDGGDCELECIDSACSEIYQSWIWLMGSSVYNIDIPSLCSTVFPVAIDMFGTPKYHDWNDNCSETSNAFDYNKDGYINFREWVPLVYCFIDVCDEFEWA
eukprot:569140_1